MKLRNPAVENDTLDEKINDRILRRADESGSIDELAKTYLPN